jgi:hypothetical protein
MVDLSPPRPSHGAARSVVVERRGDGGRLDDCPVEVAENECTVRVQRLPACQHQQFEPVSQAVLTEACPEKAGDSSQPWQHCSTEMQRDAWARAEAAWVRDW